MIKQIFLPLSIKHDRNELSIAEHNQQAREIIETRRTHMRERIAAAESELDRAFNEGYSIMSKTLSESEKGCDIHYLLHKPGFVIREIEGQGADNE